MPPTPPAGKLRWDRVFLVLVILGIAGFSLYWFALR